MVAASDGIVFVLMMKSASAKSNGHGSLSACSVVVVDMVVGDMVGKGNKSGGTALVIGRTITGPSAWAHAHKPVISRLVQKMTIKLVSTKHEDW
jgi:hypothetical protein